MPQREERNLELMPRAVGIRDRRPSHTIRYDANISRRLGEDRKI